MRDWPLEKANFAVGGNSRFFYLELSRKSLKASTGTFSWSILHKNKS